MPCTFGWVSTAIRRNQKTTMRKLIEPSDLVKAVQLQLMLERDQCMRDCDEALALRFVDRVKRAAREDERPTVEVAA